MRLHEKHHETEMHVQKIVTPEWLKRRYVFHFLVLDVRKVSEKTFLARQLPLNRNRWSLDRSWEFVVGERLLMKAERHL